MAVEDALRLSAISCDAVKHLVLAKIERRVPRLSLSDYPFLPLATVGSTDVRDYPKAAMPFSFCVSDLLCRAMWHSLRSYFLRKNFLQARALYWIGCGRGTI